MMVMVVMVVVMIVVMVVIVVVVMVVVMVVMASWKQKGQFTMEWNTCNFLSHDNVGNHRRCAYTSLFWLTIAQQETQRNI